MSRLLFLFNYYNSCFPKKDTNLWNLLPSDFCVLYNIDKEKEEEFCYGYFVIDGSIMLGKKSKEIARIGSYGHLYINPDDYSRIKESYKKDFEFKANIQE